MDFFHGLDDTKYMEFKQNMKSGWALQSIQPPKTVNKIYRLAGMWVKPKSRSETGVAATYHTIARKQGKPKDDSNGDKKPQKDLSKVQPGVRTVKETCTLW